MPFINKTWHLLLLFGFYACTLVISDDVAIVVDIVNATIWTGPVVSDGYLELTPIPSIDLYTPVAVDYDPVEGKLYWTDITRNTISRANLDGSGEEVFVSFLDVPEGLAIDHINRVLYWIDSRYANIEIINLDGTGRAVIIDTDMHKPRAIVVDSTAGFIFWSDWGNHTKIERANLNGTERMLFVDTDLIRPSGLALDFEDQRLYWCDPGMDRIESVDFNGGDRRDLFEGASFDTGAYDLAISGDDIYWTDWLYLNLIRMDKYAGLASLEAATPALLQQGGGIHIVNIPPPTTSRPTTQAPDPPTTKIPTTDATTSPTAATTKSLRPTTVETSRTTSITGVPTTKEVPETSTKSTMTVATSEPPGDPTGPDTIVIAVSVAGCAVVCILIIVIIVIFSRKSRKSTTVTETPATSLTRKESEHLYMEPYSMFEREGSKDTTTAIYDDTIQGYNSYISN